MKNNNFITGFFEVKTGCFWSDYFVVCFVCFVCFVCVFGVVGVWCEVVDCGYCSFPPPFSRNIFAKIFNKNGILFKF